MSVVPLKFIVVGASVAGLTCAYKLRSFGHNVVVVETHDDDYTHEGGLRVPPNMARLLQEFPGIVEVLEAKGQKCSGINFCAAETIELLGTMPFSAEVMADLGADFYMISHQDYCSHVYSLCKDSGIHFRHNFCVESLEVSDTHPPVVVSTSGERLVGDIIIGADGRNSVTRRSISAHDSEASEEDETVIALLGRGDKHKAPALRIFPGGSFTIPVSEMNKDPALKQIVETSKFQIWMGDGTSLTGGRASKDLYVVGMTRSQPPVEGDMDQDWRTSHSADAFMETIPEFNSKLKELLRLATGFHPTVQYVHDLDSFIDDTQSVVVIGDAAHATPIHGTYNSALSVEDAFTIGRLFSHHTSRSQIPTLLKGYDEIRHPRTKYVESYEINGLLTIALPPGPYREMRNQGLRQTLDMQSAPDENSEALAHQWENWIILFNYDAKDAVDEWWLNWGRHVQTMADEI